MNKDKPNRVWVAIGPSGYPILSTVARTRDVCVLSTRTYLGVDNLWERYGKNYRFVRATLVLDLKKKSNP